MGEAKSFTKLWIPVIVYAILIFWVSSLESPLGIELEFNNADKAIHFFEYLILGVLLIRAINGSYPGIPNISVILITVAIGALYGFTDELHQSVIPGRFATVSDFIFDFAGVVTGALLYSGRKIFPKLAKR